MNARPILPRLIPRRSLLVVTLAVVVATLPTASALAQPAPATQPATDVTLGELAKLKQALGDAYNAGDVDRMLTYLHPKVLIIWPDGDVLEGREALRAYYDRMLKGPDPVVKKFSSDPVVDGRDYRDDVDLSWGRMNDHYELTSGESFGLGSRFTATVIKLPDGPPETGGWMIRSFHASTDAFDNPVLKMAAQRSFLYGGAGGLILGIVVGLIGATLAARRRKRVEPST
jgi:hypothetical protein